METARLNKRFWSYIINLVFYLGIGFAAASPLLILTTAHIIFYFLTSFGSAIILSFFFDLFLLVVTKGYNIGSAIMGVKYVTNNGERINRRQSMIRSASESTLVLVFLDLIYFLRYRTERGVIDRLSDSFAIDTRL